MILHSTDLTFRQRCIVYETVLHFTRTYLVYISENIVHV